MKIILIALIILPITIGCGSKRKAKKQTESNMEITQIEFISLQTGNLFGAGDEGIEQSAILATNESELNQIIGKMNSVNPSVSLVDITVSYPLKEHNFIFVFDQVRGSGGHTIKTKSVVLHADRTEVTAKTSAPEGPATTVMTQPYEIIAVPKQALKPLKLVIGE
jgi:hypothetical protein